MYSDTVIEAEDISKVYLLYNKPEDRLKQMLIPKLKRLAAPILGGVIPRVAADMPRYREFWALRDVSLNLRAHETLGIIGQNGSGKSTLLQIICGTLMPSSGVVQSEGRVAALLELGAGFNPDFTGRENVYLNAAIYGLTTAEIEQRMASIIEFAEIGEHIDQPVKTYSSGMFVRLAFSVIANVDADILIIDEALAVGDAYFQQKCMRFLRKFQEHGSIFFVSHDTGAMMSFCDRVIWLHHGMIKAQGDPKEVCEEYLAYLYQKHSNVSEAALSQTELAQVVVDEFVAGGVEEDISTDVESLVNKRSFGDGGAEIMECRLCDEDGKTLQTIAGGESVSIQVKFRAKNEIKSVISGFVVKDRLGQYIFGDNTFMSTASSPVNLKKGAQSQAQFSFVMPMLAPGTYSIVISVASGTLASHVQHHWIHEAIIFHSHADINTGVMIKIPVTAEVIPT
ncbi:ABC transporter ATP-binding protein [Ochrobactrum teleogrylli]|uniref:ABC transporter ATP-binding protein n=1 Tax=Ochrobactrum teleogrylli TaxID=2479765 RepID=A0ABY2XYG3_9HYPH|nr:ABC transporter ATP-binding protein [[Ochrobactrum] teleogrylli]TNV09768.1 ABC transporter ATP-binding protein [[Ochrobactrum] teleogrylli]